MGLFVSFIRSRKPARCREEREPLLDSELEESRQVKHLFRKLVHIVAALDAGKLPSQHQLNHLIKVALKSEILYPTEGSSSLAGHKVLLDVREFLGLLAVFGLEKNCRYRLQVMREFNHNLINSSDDDKVQNIIYHAQCLTYTPPEPDELIILEPPTELDPVLQRTSLITSELQTDIPLLFASLYSLLALFLTSTTFRIVTSNLFLLARQYFSSSLVEGVRKVEHAAEIVARAAETTQNLTECAVNLVDQVHVAAEGVGLSAMGIGDVARDTERVALLAISEGGPLHGLEGLKDHTHEITEHTICEVQARQKEHVARQQDMKEPTNNFVDESQRRQEQHLDADRAKAEASQTEDRKDAIIEAIQQTLLDIHKHPAQISALRTILLLTRRYINHYRALCALRLRNPGSYIPELDLSDSDTPQWRHLTSILAASKELLDRLTRSGNHGGSLDSLLRAFRDVVVLPLDEFDQNEEFDGPSSQIKKRNESSLLFEIATSVNLIADSALGTGTSQNSDTEQVEYIASNLFRSDTRVLVEKVREVKRETGSSSSPFLNSNHIESHPIPTPKLHIFYQELETFLAALYDDRSSQRLARALVTLGRDIQSYFQPSSHLLGEDLRRSSKTTPLSSILTTVLNDLIGYLIPKVVGGVMDYLFSQKNIAMTRPTTNHSYDPNPDATYSESVRREQRFPLPLPRVELVSDTSTFPSSSSLLPTGSEFSGTTTASRWLEGALDMRLMHIRISDDKEMESQWKEDRLTSCFRWCCCSSPPSDITDPYVNAEGGYGAAYMRTTELERELGTRTRNQTDLANLLTPSSISITQWNETRVDFFSSHTKTMVVDAEPLLIDLNVPGEDMNHEVPVQAPTLVGFDVATTSASPVTVPSTSPLRAPLNDMDRDPASEDPYIDSDDQRGHLLALVQDKSFEERSRSRGGRMKTEIKTLHKIRVHIEGILSSLPSILNEPNHTSRGEPANPHLSVTSKVTQRLTLENIAYYARYNVLSTVFGTWLGVRDEGVLDLEFEFQDINGNIMGAAKYDGAFLDVDIDLDTSTWLENLFSLDDSGDESDPEADLPFRASNVRFVLPHTLNITPRLRTLPRSTLLSMLTSLPRKILLALLLRPVVLPLAKLVIRRELESAFAQGIERGCDFVVGLTVRVFRGAKRRARKRAAKIKSEADVLATEGRMTAPPDLYGSQVSFGDVWASIMEVLGEITAVEEGPETIVHTKMKEARARGVQVEHTVVELDGNSHESDRSQRELDQRVKDKLVATNTTTIAIGIAPQLLPDKADLVSNVLPSTEPTEVVDGVIGAIVQDAVDQAGEVVKDGLEHAADVMQGAQNVVQKAADVAEGVREGIDEGRQRAEQMEEDEWGWRSVAFDL
ncbi:uncharacterized protein C8R40DRAFT_1132563 [Lentinula edodes]|uniref:uncharacterized protein n=1 Tax=Lentinula edodes TaxID=5353 RepID=UPI001E8DD43D|nr:uncharacterized protein C8R40DRAFT_1132563 [Lentinula edodes]KAH7869060.1 hypothetical protein C8R40DRAFT_1132563 [Lentinula edodes]